MQVQLNQPDPINAIRTNLNQEMVKEFNRSLEGLCNSKEGRHFLGEIFRVFHMYETPHNDHGAKTSFNCGQQSVCFQIRNWIKSAGIYMEYWPQIEKDSLQRSLHWDNVFKEKEKEIFEKMKEVEKNQKRS